MSINETGMDLSKSEDHHLCTVLICLELARLRYLNKNSSKACVKIGYLFCHILSNDFWCHNFLSLFRIESLFGWTTGNILKRVLTRLYR